MSQLPSDARLTKAQQKTRQRLIETAMNMSEQGVLPTLTEVANAAELSRATAYRYFPTQSDLVAAMVKESLGPILDWKPSHPGSRERISELLSFAYPRLLEHEGVLRAALQLSLQQWAEQRRQPQSKERLVRGNRKKVLELAVEPLKDTLSPEHLQRVLYAFSIIYGSEVLMVMKDIWHAGDEQIQDVTQWMAKAILRQAEEDEKTVRDTVRQSSVPGDHPSAK